METLMEALRHVGALDDQFGAFIESVGVWAYAVLFLLAFCQPSFLVGPAVPGNLLMFSSGLFAHDGLGSLAVFPVWVALTLGVFIGQGLNFGIGWWLGPRVMHFRRGPLREENRQRVHEFFERHGTKAVTIAPLVPFVRSFAPVVAGIARMDVRPFFGSALLGSLAWTTILVPTGYFFGHVPFVKDNLPFLALAAMILVTSKVVYDAVRRRRAARAKRA